MNDAFDYAKQKREKSHKVPDFKVGDLVLVSNFNFNDIKGQKKLEDSYVGPFVIVSIHGMNAVQVEWSGKLEKNTLPFQNQTPLSKPPVEQSEDKKIKKVIKERRLMGKDQRKYLVRYRDLVHEWIQA
ncbi:hypothetical protein O181_108480 [Austropuccinia psidii MF-1]|uniref:Uncharacterized protein n=1 Tax=Austropuccinia psidii MF-1 TaxID=1389203 RepID=A0A9Q3JWH6_9BASI|nr:hypothetical protein [Austropuccinia psidii MF-1]